MKANTTNIYSLLILSLVIILTEACFGPPPPPPPSPTTTKAPTTTAKATTTGKPKDCPLDGKTCLDGTNLLELKAADGPDKCNEECEKYADSKCKAWSYVGTRKLCFLLSSCVEKAEDGVLSGEKGCKIPSSMLTVFNLSPDKAAKTIKIEWENPTVCPDTVLTEDIAALKSAKVTYFEKPDSLKCGKMKKVTGKIDAEECKPDLEDKEPADIYFKMDLSDAAKTKCLIELTPKFG